MKVTSPELFTPACSSQLPPKLSRHADGTAAQAPRHAASAAASRYGNQSSKLLAAAQFTSDLHRMLA